MEKREGLTTSEAQQRIQQYGYNEIIEKKENPFIKFLKYFWGPIPWMIEAAAIVSAIIKHWADFWIISALLLLNAIVGYWQEHKADKAIELLKQKLALKAKALRDGKWQEIPARELVPGDTIRIRLGDIIPADVKLTEGDYLLVDQSALTGESLPVEKHISETAYSGSIARQGEMNAEVTATGMKTYFGKTAKLVEEAKTQSHFQKAVVKIGDYLIILAIALIAIIFIASYLRGEKLIETLQFALVLIVAAIPAAMPAVLSVSMAVGATALARKNAIVRKLSAVEETAGIDILCSDKTGTITKNELTIGKIQAFNKFTEKEILTAAALASREEDKDPIDTTIIAKAKITAHKIIKYKPFDPVTKRTEATLKEFKASKGAPQAILKLTADKKLAKKVNETINKFAQKGYRALGVAKTVKGKWKFMGLIPLYDPPREDSASTIKTAEQMGVDVKMVTGDHISIAKEIAQQVNLGTNIQLADKIENPETADGFAEVFPEHKYHIVELLQQKGHIVGMTGDGVNDAPALKKADVGIAVAGATDAAKNAADIVLTNPGLSVIIDAIQESRKIFQRMTNYSTYRITETIRVLFFITLSILVFKFYPVTALMIVLLAILNDAPIMTMSLDNVKISDKPERWNMKTLLKMATILGIIGVGASFGILYIGKEVLKLSPEILQSFIYLKLSVAGHMTVFIARTKGYFWTIKPALPLLAAVIITQLVATLITVYGILLPAMGWKLAGFVWGFAAIAFIITDIIKVQVYKIIG